MTTTNFNNGVSSFGIPVLGSGANPLSGHAIFVSSVASDGGADGNDGSYSSPLLTFAQAISNCVASRGDVIYLMPGYTQTISAASGVALNKAGVTVIGMGNGANRPTFTFSATTSTFAISAAGVTVKNIIGTPSVDSVASGFLVSAANVTLGTPDAPVVWQDASAAIEAISAVLTTAAADNFVCNLKYEGFIAGNAVARAINLVGVNNGQINVDFYGITSTAVVGFTTTACTNIVIGGTFYVSGTTDLSLNVVDTVGASTWSVQGFDAAAGASFSGGSAAAVASDDVSTVNAKIGTITNTGGTATIGGVLGDFANTTLISKLNVPTADATANVDVGDVVGNKTDAGVQAVAADK